MGLHPDIRKYYVYRALLKRFALPILVLYGLDQGLSLEQLALITLVSHIFSMVLEIPSGAIADTIGHRRALVFSMLGQALSMFMYLGGTFWWMMAGGVLYFAAGTLMTGTSEALFFERLKTLGLVDQHLKLHGQGKGFATAVSVVSMLLAGVTYEVAWWLPFVIGTLQFLLAAVVISSFGEAKQTESVQKREGFASVLRHIPRAIREIHREPRAFWLIISNALIIGPLFTLGEFQQAILSDVGLTAVAIGFVYAMKRLLGVILQSTAHRMSAWFGAWRFTAASGVLFVSHMWLVAAFKEPAALIFALLLGSLAWVSLDIAVNDYLNQWLGTSSRATVLSVNNMLRNIVSVAAVAFYGAFVVGHRAADAYGWTGMVFAILLIVPLFKLYTSIRRHDAARV